jgi:hypothetical protein
MTGQSAGIVTSIPLFRADADRDANPGWTEGDLSYSHESGYCWFNGSAWVSFTVITHEAAYTYNAAVPPPADGEFRANTTSLDQATTLAFANLDDQGVDQARRFISYLVRVDVQDLDNGDAFVRYRVTAVAQQGTWAQLTVEHIVTGPGGYPPAGKKGGVIATLISAA